MLWVPPVLLDCILNESTHHIAANDLINRGQIGSGKTRTADAIRDHLFAISDTSTRISNYVKCMSTVLEAFGTDTTPTRRFGCYQELQYANRRICGLKLLSYNLNTSNLNFKIFYYLMIGATNEERAEWNFTNDEFAYLPKLLPKDKSSLSSFDSQHLQMIRDSLTKIKLGKLRQDLIFRLLAGIMHLGNIEFIADEAKDQNAACTIKNVHELDVTAALFGVSSRDLELTLTCKTRLVRKQV